MIWITTLLAPILKSKGSTKLIGILILLIIFLSTSGFILYKKHVNTVEKLKIAKRNVEYYQEGYKIYKTKDEMNAAKIGKLEISAKEFKHSTDSVQQYLLQQYLSLKEKQRVKNLNSVTQIGINTIDTVTLTISTITKDTVYASYSDNFATISIKIPTVICENNFISQIPTEYSINNEILIFDVWEREYKKFFLWRWLGFGDKIGQIEVKTTNPKSIITNMNHTVIFNKHNKK